MRKPIIAGNWKMHLTLDEARSFMQEVKEQVPAKEKIDTVICAPFTHLSALAELAQDGPVAIGAQNMHYEEQGAFTGEISPVMLKTIGVQYVIIGHSERREYFGETDELVNAKLKAAHQHGLVPIVCVGENLEQWEQEETKTVVKKQVEAAFEELTSEQATNTVVAYEPIWAIGTGKSSTAEAAGEVISFIRRVIEDQYDQQVAASVRIQYGGSVKPENIAEYLAQPDIDGALVGGASLKPASFLQLLGGRS